MASQPLISVIVPVYNVAAYLGDCLDSVLGPVSVPGPQVTGIEVIAIDDASSDGGGQALDARAALDPRLQVVHLPDNSGPGNARNVGLALAAGEYIWFVDADDTLADGALAGVADRIRSERPDVLLIGYENLYPDGHAEPSRGRAVLSAAPAGPVTLADRPQLLQLTMTSWSKVIRREFLVRLALPFPAGIHEDVLLSCALLLGAGRISALDRVCYRYRQGRSGSFMIKTTEDHFDIFASYRLAFELVAKRRADGDASITGPIQAALFERAIWHYTTVLDGAGSGTTGARGRVPGNARRRYFALMHDDFAAHRPAGYRRPRGLRGVKYWLIERNAYLGYAALEPVNRLRVRMSRSRPGRAPERMLA